MRNDVLVLGIGNLLLGDEGLGVHVAQRMQRETLPENVVVIDGGTGGFELLEYVEGATKVIIVDAIAYDAPPGTIVRLTPLDVAGDGLPLSVHEAGIHDLLRYCQFNQPKIEIVLLGVVPQRIEPCIGLSLVVESVVDQLIGAVLEEASAETYTADP